MQTTFEVRRLDGDDVTVARQTLQLMADVFEEATAAASRAVSRASNRARFDVPLRSSHAGVILRKIQ